MPVRVDNMKSCMKNRKWRSSEACHLFCDDDSELGDLHHLAHDIGLRRSWFQGKSEMPHYDLVRDKRRLAVLKGAVETTDRDMVTILRQWRKKRLAKGQAER